MRDLYVFDFRQNLDDYMYDLTGVPAITGRQRGKHPGFLMDHTAIGNRYDAPNTISFLINVCWTTLTADNIYTAT